MTAAKPDIIEVIERYTPVRKRGREYVALAPCHDDRRPSLRINAEKQAWYCDPCGRGGDVIDYVMIADRLTFPDALRALGIGSDRPPARRKGPIKAAALLAHWLNRQHLLTAARCRELSAQIAIADTIPDRQGATTFYCGWEILGDLHADLATPGFAGELWESRQSIEALTADIEMEPPERFPPLTSEYLEYLKDVVPC